MNRWTFLAAGLVFAGVAHCAEPAAPGFDLVLVDMQGQKKVLGTVGTSAISPRVSPDGTRVAYEQADPTAPSGPQSVLLMVAQLNKFDQKKALQPTLTTVKSFYPVWSADSDWVAFVATGNGNDSIFWERSDGYIQPKFLADGRAPEGMYHGGMLGQLTFITRKGDKDYGISLLDLSTRKITRIDQAGSAQLGSDISTDGKWIAYASDETGRQEIWLEPLPLTGKRVQLTREGGSHPQWSPDGSKLYFDQGGKLYRMDLSPAGEALKAGNPAALPITGFVQQHEMVRQYDLTPDGKAFVMLFRRAP